MFVFRYGSLHMSTRHRWWQAAAITTVALGVGVAISASLVAQAPAAKRSVWDGVYTDAQARRGETQYGRSCEQCHGADLSGNQVDEIPSLVWDAFMMQWSGKTAKDLFEQLSRSMPRDKPGSLSPRAYTDLIAYILEANKIPSGNQELDRSPERLEQIVIERSKQ